VEVDLGFKGRAHPLTGGYGIPHFVIVNTWHKKQKGKKNEADQFIINNSSAVFDRQCTGKDRAKCN
jgi:hypothetical protein